MDRMRWLCRVGMVVLGICVSARATLAQPSIDVLEPTSLQLFYEDVPIDSASPPQRIRLRNVGDQAIEFIEVNLPRYYEVVATEGNLGPGGEQSWDIVCVPEETAPGGDFLDIIMCADGCEIEIWETFIVTCDAGLLDAPLADVFLPGVYQGQESRATIPISNPQPTPLTITAVETAAPFSAALETGTLPVTVQPGETVGIVAEFDTTAPDTDGTLDVVVSGGLIAERLRLRASTLKQIAPSTWDFQLVPQGAVYTVPITIHNAASVPRVITSASFDSAEFAVSDVVGATLPPGQALTALVSVTAGTLGLRSAALTVTFDAEPLAIAWFSATVMPALFSLLTEDAAASDGWLDFGTRQSGSPPIERTVTVVNQSGVDRAVFGCSSHLPPLELLACPSSIPDGGSAELVMRFSPGPAGSVLDELRIGIEAAGGADAFVVTVPVRARTVDQPYEPAARFLAFPTTLRGATRQASLRIDNTGSAPISLPIAVQGDAFSLVGPDAVSIPVEAGAEVVVEFHPDAVGDFAGSLEVGEPGVPERISIPLSGRATASIIEYDPEFDFGEVALGTTAEASVALRNLDPEVSFDIGELTASGDGFSAVTPVVSTLGPGASIEIAVRFSPEQVGAATGQLVIPLSGDGSAPATVTLRGQGVAMDPDGPGDDGDETDGDDGADGAEDGEEPETSGCTSGPRGHRGSQALLVLLALLAVRRAGATRPRASARARRS
jgi:Abnormal spindle-like microcephaly-assoc'd, ASPM-SPD-2-Hydin